MTKKKLALALLVTGVSCLTGYILLLFYTDTPALTVAALVSSIACNAAALNLYLTAKSRKRDEDDV